MVTTASAAPSTTTGEVEPASRWRLTALSFTMFFIELALIRWTAANNVHLAYITNFVLLASFLGVGVGFLRAHSSRDLFRWTPVALAGLVGFELLFPVKVVTLSASYPFKGAFGLPALSQWISLPIIFGTVVVMLAGVGQAMARAFAQFQPLEAYRLDILGSLAGIALFSVISFLDLPPIAWAVVAATGLVTLAGRRQRQWQWGAVVVVVILLGVESLSPTDHWSPYYKITAVQPPGTHGVLMVSANNIRHQTLYPIATLHRIKFWYFFPYRHLDPASLENVLIVGAGTGNDVGIALAEGARHIDAVEIDPVLVQLGRRYNPEHAYQNPRVTVHIDDGRAFLQNTDQRYNLIIFALPDSLTALAGQSALRLENYLFTSQALHLARSHLATGGMYTMYNYYQPFLLDRYASTLTDAFGARPCTELGNTVNGRNEAVLSVRANGQLPNCNSPWRGQRVTPASDDWPFPYLPSRSIPSYYLWVIGLILAGALVVVRRAGGPFTRMASYVDLAFMGSAFLLLESKNIVQFALLFGTTWFVNSLVFTGVLGSVYAAIETARHVRLPSPAVLYGALLVALGVAWAIPQESLLGLPTVLRFLAATAIAFAPVFLANLVFAQRFKDVGSSTTAFAANLLGAIVGGVLEYLSLITGYRFLLVVVAALYAFAFLFGRRHLAQLHSGG
jgi:hypothetical protein